MLEKFINLSVKKVVRMFIYGILYSDDEYITSSDLVWVNTEKQYLKTLEEIMNTGILTNDRTGVAQNHYLENDLNIILKMVFRH